MKVEIIDVKKQLCSCNFCKRGTLNERGTGLVYPYDVVYCLSGDKGGVTAHACKECLDSLITGLNNLNLK